MHDVPSNIPLFQCFLHPCMSYWFQLQWHSLQQHRIGCFSINWHCFSSPFFYCWSGPDNCLPDESPSVQPNLSFRSSLFFHSCALVWSPLGIRLSILLFSIHERTYRFVYRPWSFSFSLLNEYHRYDRTISFLKLLKIICELEREFSFQRLL